MIIKAPDGFKLKRYLVLISGDYHSVAMTRLKVLFICGYSRKWKEHCDCLRLNWG